MCAELLYMKGLSICPMYRNIKWAHVCFRSEYCCTLRDCRHKSLPVSLSRSLTLFLSLTLPQYFHLQNGIMLLTNSVKRLEICGARYYMYTVDL